MTEIAKKRDLFSTLLPIFLLVAVILSVISNYYGVKLEAQTYSAMKSAFFVPLKQWTFFVIGAAMFSIFFRSPQGATKKFIVLVFDIMLLYLISTTIANIYAVGAFQLFPFKEVIEPLLGGANEVIFDKKAPQGIPLVILVMIGGVTASVIFRFFTHGIFAFIAKNLCALLTAIFAAAIFDKFSYIRNLKAEHQNALQTNSRIDHSLALINFSDRIIFGILMLILFIAPLAVYASFLEILNARGLQFFSDLGKFIAFYGAILLFYQFFIITVIRALDWAKQAQELGAGEILLTSMDKDGTKSGYDLQLLNIISTNLHIPVIASGGVGNLDHILDGVKNGASAVLAASIFHFRQHTIQEAKNYLSQNSIAVRS